MKASRRQFLSGAALAGTTLATAESVRAARRASPLLGVTPDLPSLPHTLENGVKVFHLTAEPVKRRIVPFKTMDVWGYNGTSPGPAIQVNQGDRVRIVFENRLPESTTIHWHGLEVPIEMDGVPYISQPAGAPAGAGPLFRPTPSPTPRGWSSIGSRSTGSRGLRPLRSSRGREAASASASSTWEWTTIPFTSTDISS